MEALMIQDEDPPEIHEIPSPSNDSSNEEASSSMGEFQYGPDVKVGIEELCPICGDKVSGYHYGLQTCESCKGFFKRTVQNKKVYSCVDNRNCAIDKAQRKRCPYCRFQKCLSVGMKLEAVRPDRMRGGRNKFGPMYKRDRAIKQQAVRQRQQMLAQCQMQLNQLNGMSPGSMSGYPSMDSPPDIKPNVAMYMSGHQGQMGPSNMLGSPGRHMMPIGTEDNSLPSSPPPPHSTSQGHYRDIIPPPPHSYQSMMHGLPQPINQLPSPPLQSHGHHSNNNMVLSNMSNHSPPVPMPASTPSPTVPQLIKDLQVNLPNEDEVQEKLRGVVEAQLSSMHPHMMLHQLNMLSQTQTVPKELLQFCCMIVDQNLFLLVEWARTAPFFKELKVEDQMKLLQHCWSEILILEYIMKQSKNELDDITLATGHRIPITVIDKLGLADCRERLQELIKKFKELNVDQNEHTCLKFLILLNPDISGILDRQHVEQSQEKVNTALLAYCSSFYANTRDKFGQLLVRLPEIRLISLRAEEYLYFRHLNGDIQEQTLLMEMLHAKRK